MTSSCADTSAQRLLHRGGRNALLCDDHAVATSHHIRVIEQLRHAVVTFLQGGQPPVQSLRDIVDFMRKNETPFPHFRTSATYKLFEPPIFENKKQANGYWF